tara:strand:+ start:36373 stop:36567 length:195 start_codon:yes stop_codon:yes gene_type:complete
LGILPEGFVLMRHYVFLRSTSKGIPLKELQTQLGKPEQATPKLSLHLLYPKYKQEHLQTIAVFW